MPDDAGMASRGPGAEGDSSPGASSERYRFDGVELDVTARTLTRDGAEIGLAPRVFALLEHLVLHAGEALAREDLLDTVWGGVVVSDQSLTEAIWRLRRALGDDSRDPRFIATIPGYGFRFIADVETVAPPPDRGPGAGTDFTPRVPLWKLALPGAALSGLLLAAALVGVFLEAGPPTPARAALRELMAASDRPVLDPAAQLSPDGTRLVFARSDPPRLQLLELQSGGVTDLGALERAWNGRSYVWSNDGASIALGDRPRWGGAGRIEIFDLAAGRRFRLAEHREELYIPAGWGPGDQRLLTLVARVGGNRRSIRLLDRGGEGLREWELESDAEGRVSPDGRWLALARQTDEGGEIVIVPIEGIWTRPEDIPDDHFLDLARWGRVTDPPCAGDAPHWGPGSDRLVFFTFRSGRRELWTVDLEEGRPLRQPEPLRVPGDPFTIAGWAADGNVVFCSLRTFHDVAVVTIDAAAGEVVGEPERLTLWEGRARSPSWSSDPDRLLFKGFGGEGGGDAYIAQLGPDPEGTSTERAIEAAGIDIPLRAPAWSGDGSKVYFASWLPEGGQGLYEQDLASGNRRRVIPEHTLVAPTPRLASDAGLLLFNNADATPYPRLRDVVTLPQGLYLLDLDGGELRQIDTTTSRAAAISADGSRIAFTDDDRVEIWSIALQEGERRLLRTLDDGWQLWPPFAFSPDGDRLAYIARRAASEGLCEQHQLWILDVADGAARKLDALDELGVNDVAWSADGSRLALGLYDCQSSVKLYEH